LKNSQTKMGFLLLIGILILSLLSFYYNQYNEINLKNTLIPIFSKDNILGTDQFGRDVFSRISKATYISIVIGTISNLIASIIGVLFGTIAGFYKKLDLIIMRIIEIMQSFPTLLILIAMISIFTPSIQLTIFIIGIVSWPSIARVVRAQVLLVKSREYIIAATAMGYPQNRIILYHVLLNCLSPIIIIFTLGVSNSIMFESGLSFLGLGVQPPDPSLGRMINEGKDFIITSPELFILPSMVLSTIIISFNLLGEGLREALEVKK
tara:strand:+ start:476 stop:1270 length:795 start_codon:yes stop_codon:yes gene_type:complete